MTDSALVPVGGPPPARIPAAPGQMSQAEILEGLQAMASVLAPDANLTAPELQLFAMVSARLALDPFARQLFAIRRQGRLTFQQSIDGYRSTAARTGEYAGSEEPVYGERIQPDDAARRAGWLKPWPESATVVVRRLLPGGTILTQSATAWWDEYVPGPPNDFRWKQAPRAQLAKCAEALALRKAFPYVLADVFVAEEMDRSGSQDAAAAEAARVAALPTAADRTAERRRAIEGRSSVQDTPAAAVSPASAGEVSAGAGAPAAAPRRGRGRPAAGPPEEPPGLPPEPSGPARPSPVAGDPSRLEQAEPSPGARADAAPVAPPAAVSGEVIETPPGPMVACDSPSPYPDSPEACGLARGHRGDHRNRQRASWAPGR